MRNNKTKFNISTHIETSNKVLKAVERKLSDEIINCCKIEFADEYNGHNGYCIKATYLNDSESRKVLELYFSVRSYDAWVWMKDCTYLKKNDYKKEITQTNKQFECLAEPPNYSGREKQVFKEVVKYIVDTLIYTFSSPGEKFVMDSSKFIEKDNQLI